MQARRAPLIWYLVPFLGVLGIAGAALWKSPSAESASVEPFTALSGSESTPAFSPDASRVAFSWAPEGQSRHLYIKATAGGPERQLTAGPASDSYPAWSPDGSLIAFEREFDQHGMALWVTRVSGGGERRIQALAGERGSRISWSADGKALAVVDSDSRESPPAIFLVSLDSGVKRRITTPPEVGAGDRQPAFSPDGRRLAFLRNEGSFQIAKLYVLPVDGGGLPLGKPTSIQTDRADLNAIDWSADGRSLICAAVGGLLRVPVGGGGGATASFSGRDGSVGLLAAGASWCTPARLNKRLCFVCLVQVGWARSPN